MPFFWQRRSADRKDRDAAERAMAKGAAAAATSNDYTSMEEATPRMNNTSIVADDEEEEPEVYIVRQRYGVCAIVISVVQVIILGLMMWQCGVAPLALNPMFGPWPDSLSEWGGKNSVLILQDGETYRLLTPVLLHAGVLHLLGNVAVQLESGVFFEKEWGSLRWCIVYVVSGIGSSIASVIYMPLAVSVGSSGAVMGLFGAKLSEVVLRACERSRTPHEKVAATVRKEQCCVVTASVVVVLLFSFLPFVDWAAHLGGLVTGMLVGVAIFSLEVRGPVWKMMWFGFGILTTAGAFVVALTYMYSGQVETMDELRDVCGYYTENFEEYECNCMRDEYLSNNNNGE